MKDWRGRLPWNDVLPLQNLRLFLIHLGKITQQIQVGLGLFQIYQQEEIARSSWWHQWNKETYTCWLFRVLFLIWLWDKWCLDLEEVIFLKNCEWATIESNKKQYFHIITAIKRWLYHGLLQYSCIIERKEIYQAAYWIITPS